MLKRQRAASPSPTRSYPEDGPTHGLPMPAGAPEFVPRVSKRRRTAAPVLDGALRGWGPAVSMEDEFDEEEWSDEEEEEEGLVAERQSVGRGYQAANTLLHQLHSQHQHRLHDGSSASPSSPSWAESSRYLEEQHRRPYSSMPPQTSPPAEPSWTKSNKLLAQTQLTQHWDLQQAYYASPPECKTLPATLRPPTPEETERVKERYEDTNKLLGSLFLHRRRELFGDHNGP